VKREDIEKRTEELVMPILDSGGYMLWDVEYVKEGQDMYLRVYADKEGGININDCVDISRSLETKLDEEDFIKDAYILEVSSPGLTRKLKKERDYLRSIGKRVDVKLYKASDGLKEFEAELKSFDEGVFVFALEDKDITINEKDISSLRLAFVD
jgi:ribosome maturation factor RimP